MILASFQITSSVHRFSRDVGPERQQVGQVLSSFEGHVLATLLRDELVHHVPHMFQIVVREVRGLRMVAKIHVEYSRIFICQVRFAHSRETGDDVCPLRSRVHDFLGGHLCYAG